MLLPLAAATVASPAPHPSTLLHADWCASASAHSPPVSAVSPHSFQDLAVGLRSGLKGALRLEGGLRTGRRVGPGAVGSGVAGGREGGGERDHEEHGRV